MKVAAASKHEIENTDSDSNPENLKGREGEGKKSNNSLDKRSLVESNKQSQGVWELDSARCYCVKWKMTDAKKHTKNVPCLSTCKN